jgi:hypothetical protein
VIHVRRKGKKFLAGSSLSVETATPVVNPQTFQTTASDIARASAQFRPNKKCGRTAVNKPSLVLVHQCQQKLDGRSERCSCKAKIPRADADRLVIEGTHKWLTAVRDGDTYVLTNSIVALVPKAKAPTQTVRVHGCFDITKGEKPERCYCNVQLSVPEADEMIADGTATWLMATREVRGVKQTYPIHNAIVLTAEEYAKRKSWIKAMKPGRPVAKFRAALRDALTVEQILDGLEDPEKFCNECPQVFPDGFSKPSYITPFTDKRADVYRPHSYLIECFHACIYWFWDTLLVGQKLGMSRGLFLIDAPEGAGELVTGKYDAPKLASVKAAHERATGGRRVKPKGNGPNNLSEPEPNYADYKKGDDYTDPGAGNALDAPDNPYVCLEVPDDVPPEPTLPPETLNPDKLFDQEARDDV